MRLRITLALTALVGLLGTPPATAATTELLTVGIGGAPADGETPGGTITEDGRWVVFVSSATNLVATDTNAFCGSGHDENCADIFVRDRQMQTTTLVSVDSLGAQANDASEDPDISADGHWVVFSSTATNLAASDTNYYPDCFLHNVDTGSTELVSIGVGGADVSGIHCRVSDDGRFVTFSTYTYSNVYLRDRTLGETTLLSFGGNLFGENDCWEGQNYSPSISSDGAFVLFQHTMDVYDCDIPDFLDFLFIFDRENLTWERQPVPSNRLYSGYPLDFGRFFAYGLHPPGGLFSPLRAFLRDRELGTTEEYGISSAGDHGDDSSFGGRVTSDGSLVVFSSYATNLVPGDTNLVGDAFLRDRVAGTTERFSLSSTGEQADGKSLANGIAANGTVLLFSSNGTNLVPGDTNGFRDLFIRSSVCGDSVVDRGEECDDGNLTSGDGCSTTCRLDCPPTPRMGCLTPVQSGKATIKLADRTPSTKDQLQWKWVKGALTPKSTFGQPTVTTGYRLCVYDDVGLKLTVGVAPGAGWKESPTGFKHKSKSGLPDGITTVMLKEGLVPGKARIQIKGKGALLPMPALAMLASPLTVQLSNTLAVPACWEAVYTGPFLRQDATQLKAKAN